MKEALTARIEAFLGEFPFLKRYVKAHRFGERPTVQRVDLDLMDRRANTHAFTSQFYRLNERRFILVGATGEEITEVKPQDLTQTSHRRWFLPKTWQNQIIDGETVFEALKRLPNPDDISFIVEIEDMFDRTAEWNQGDKDPDFGLRLILHKVPAGRSLSEWLTSLRQIASEELRGELAQVDADR